MTAKDLINALKAYYVELHQLGATREAEAIKQFLGRVEAIKQLLGRVK